MLPRRAPILKGGGESETSKRFTTTTQKLRRMAINPARYDRVPECLERLSSRNVRSPHISSRLTCNFLGLIFIASLKSGRQPARLSVHRVPLVLHWEGFDGLTGVFE